MLMARVGQESTASSILSTSASVASNVYSVPCETPSAFISSTCGSRPIWNSFGSMPTQFAARMQVEGSIVTVTFGMIRFHLATVDRQIPPSTNHGRRFAISRSMSLGAHSFPGRQSRFGYAESVMRFVCGVFTAALLSAQPIHFDKQVLATDLAGGYQVIACDVNGDGKPDLIALASGMTDLVWFENPTWERHVMASHLRRMINAACWARAPHSIPTVAVAYEFSMNPQESLGIVSLLAASADLREPWKASEIDRLPTSHRLRWASVDSSGDKILVNAPLVDASAHGPDYRGHVPLVYYRPGEWKRRLIGDQEEGILHGIFVTDWGHNGRDALLIGSFLGIHLYQFRPDGEWARAEIAQGSPKPWPRSGTSDISVGRCGNQRFLAAIEPWHGNEVVVYRGASGAPWRREVIDDTLLDAHTIQTADLDGDGCDEIVAGSAASLTVFTFTIGTALIGAGRSWTRAAFPLQVARSSIRLGTASWILPALARPPTIWSCIATPRFCEKSIFRGLECCALSVASEL